MLEVDDLDEDAPEWAIAIREIVSCALFYSHDFDYSAHPEDPENDDTKAAARLTALLRSTASDPSLESIL